MILQYTISFLRLPIETTKLADLWWIELQCAVNASGHARQDDPRIALEALCPPVNQRDDGAGVQNPIIIDQKRELGREGQLRQTDYTGKGKSS